MKQEFVKLMIDISRNCDTVSKDNFEKWEKKLGLDKLSGDERWNTPDAETVIDHMCDGCEFCDGDGRCILERVFSVDAPGEIEGLLIDKGVV